MLLMLFLMLPVIAPPAASAPPRTSSSPSASSPGSPVVTAAAVSPLLLHVLVTASRRHHDSSARPRKIAVITNHGRRGSDFIALESDVLDECRLPAALIASVAFYLLLLFPPPAAHSLSGLGGASRPAQVGKGSLPACLSLSPTAYVTFPQVQCKGCYEGFRFEFATAASAATRTTLLYSSTSVGPPAS